MTTAEKPQIARYKDRMDKCVTALKEEFASLRTGRASAGLLDQVMVDAYGAKSPITQLAAVSVPEPRMITVNVWDKAVVVSVKKPSATPASASIPWSRGKIFAFRSRRSPRSGVGNWPSLLGSTPSSRRWPCVTSAVTPWTI